SERDMIVLRCESKPSDLFAVLDDCGISGKQLHSVNERTDLVISRENLHDERRFRDALAQRLGNAATLEDGWSAVSVVGAGINASYVNVRTGANLLARHAIVPLMLSTSSFRITWMLPRDRADDAVKALHHGFIEAAQPLLP